MSKIDSFPYPTPIPAKIWGCFLWSRSVMLGSAEREVARLISREIIFAEFQPVWSRYLNATDRQTDRRTTCLGNTALRVASRGKNVRKAVNKWSENRHFKRPHSHLTPPLQRTPRNICINLILPKTTFPGLHFCRWQYIGSSANFRTVLSESRRR